jgi:hypothetical protein
MLKKLLLAMLATFAFASQTPTTPKTPKAVVEKSLEQAKTKGMVVENRKTTDTTDSFDLVVKDFAKLAGMPDQKGGSLDKNATTVSNPYKEFDGISMHVDINYLKDGYSTQLYLSKFPTEGMNKKEKAVVERIVKDKLIYITSDFNTQNNKYNLAFKDVDEQFDTIKIKTTAIKGHGTYDIDNLDNQDVKFNIGSLMLTPTEKKFLGEYLTINNAYINVASVPNGKMLDINYNVGVELVDANISKKLTKVNKANVDIKIGNLNRDAYNKLIEMSQSGKAIDPNSPELMALVTALLTQDLYIEIKDISLDDIIAGGQKMGGLKANAKATLKKDPNLEKMIKINPMMALSALEVEANIELSEAMLKTLSQTPKGAMLAFIPPKMENGVAKYAIKYSAGQLLVNGKPLK